MEVYYKDFISKETALEKLVDDLTLIVQGADELAQYAETALDPGTKAEIKARLEKLKEHCLKVKQQAVDSALATDRLMRRYPYSSMGFAFGLGLLAGVLFRRAQR